MGAVATPRRRMSRVERGEQLIGVAEQLIAERGVVATSMDDVAEAAGVTKPVVYDHFGSKDGLLCALIARAGDELFVRTTATVAETTGPVDALERGLRVYFETLDRADGVWWALMDATAAVSPATLEELERIRNRQAGFIAELIAGELGCDDEQALVYAHIVVGACERLASLRAQVASLTVDKATEMLLSVLWSGFETLSSGRSARSAAQAAAPAKARARSATADRRGATPRKPARSR